MNGLSDKNPFMNHPKSKIMPKFDAKTKALNEKSEHCVLEGEAKHGICCRASKVDFCAIDSRDYPGLEKALVDE